MAKKHALATVTILPPAVHHEAKKLIPAQQVQSLKFFKKLNDKDQKALVENERELTAAQMMHGLSGVAIGMKLAEAQDILSPYSKKGKGFFGQYIRQRRFSWSTAHRYIVGFRNAENSLSGPALRGAMARGWEITGDTKKPLGKFTEPVKQLGPGPTSDDPQRVNRYLDQVEQHLKERKSRLRKGAAKKDKEIEPLEYKIAVKIGYQYLFRLFHRVRKAKQQDFLEEIAGMIAKDLGVTSLSIRAQAAPDDYKPQLHAGRPALVKEGDEVATA